MSAALAMMAVLGAVKAIWPAAPAPALARQRPPVNVPALKLVRFAAVGEMLSVAPASASTVPLLVKVPVLLSVRIWPLILPLTVPLLMTLLVPPTKFAVPKIPRP